MIEAVRQELRPSVGNFVKMITQAAGYLDKKRGRGKEGMP